MFALKEAGGSLEEVAHIIQVAPTPVFLLSGLAGLLSVFSTRLGRVADKVDTLSEAIAAAEDDAAAAELSEQFDYLRKNIRGARYRRRAGRARRWRDLRRGARAFRRFPIRDGRRPGLVHTVRARAAVHLGALVAFVVEMLMAGQGLRAKARRSGEALSAEEAKRRRIANHWF